MDYRERVTLVEHIVVGNYAPFLRFYLHLRTVCAFLRNRKAYCNAVGFFVGDEIDGEAADARTKMNYPFPLVKEVLATERSEEVVTNPLISAIQYFPILPIYKNSPDASAPRLFYCAYIMIIYPITATPRSRR